MQLQNIVCRCLTSDAKCTTRDPYILAFTSKIKVCVKAVTVKRENLKAEETVAVLKEIGLKEADTAASTAKMPAIVKMPVATMHTVAVW